VKAYPRSRRIGEQIQRQLSELIRREVKDPRLGPITLTDVQVASDLAYAKVFYSVLGGTRNPELTQEILNSAAGLLRGRLGRSLGLRHSPELRFVADALVEEGARLSALIRNAVKSDEEKQKNTSDSDSGSAENTDSDS
jgi:ribosome-binding factor A